MKPIDVEYIDHELEKFFRSLKRGVKDPLLTKYRSRFLRDREGRITFEAIERSDRLSLAKKLEILCKYADFELVKSKKK